MMKYEQVWDAVDKLARINGLSPSGLAKKAGLDATTFNKSKRIRPDGKKRWPSLDSINKILEACNVSFEQFYALIDSSLEPEATNAVAVKRLSQLTKDFKITDAKLVTDGWNKMPFPAAQSNLYAVDIDVSHFEPFYRSGSMLILSKDQEIRRGDRIMIILKSGEIQIKEFIHRTASALVLCDLANPENESTIPLLDTELVNRILWAGQ